MDTQKVDRIIKQAKTFLKQNTPPQEEKYWVDSNGNLLDLPEGLYRDYKQDCFRLKKSRK